MGWFDLEDLWPFDLDRVINDLEKEICYYRKKFGLEDFNYNNFDFKNFVDFPVSSRICNYCGWWSIEKCITICSGDWKNWDLYYGAIGVLKNLNLNNLSAPINEIRDYLTAKYSKRFTLHPRLFEQVVSSVFKSIGYNAILTNYRNDGGIDIFLNKTFNDVIGVQVKRYKNNIRINEIRAFLGALVHNRIPKGVL